MDDDDGFVDVDDSEEVDFLEAGPLLTPGLRPVCNFLLYDDDDPDEELEPWDDLLPKLELVFADDDLCDVLLMVNFKPSCEDLTIYSLLLLLPPLVLRLSFNIGFEDDNFCNSLLPSGCVGVIACLCLSCCS